MITALDKNTALVLIDLQKGILQMKPAHPVQDIITRSNELIRAFRQAGLPIVIVNVNPVGAAWIHTRKDNPAVKNSASMAASMPDFTVIADEVEKLPADIFITKTTWNAFYHTPLHDELQKRQVTGIVLGGVSTSIGVEGTARAASERGYNISFAIDAMTDMSLDSHNNSLQNIFPRMGEQGTVADIIEKIGSRV